MTTKKRPQDIFKTYSYGIRVTDTLGNPAKGSEQLFEALQDYMPYSGAKRTREQQFMSYCPSDEELQIVLGISLKESDYDFPEENKKKWNKAMETMPSELKVSISNFHQLTPQPVVLIGHIRKYTD